MSFLLDRKTAVLQFLKLMLYIENSVYKFL